MFAAVAAGFVGAALGLLKEGGEDSGEGYDEGDDEKAEAHGAPERGIAGGAGLLGDVGESHSAGDEREESERGGEDVEVASHGVFLFYGQGLLPGHNVVELTEVRSPFGRCPHIRIDVWGTRLQPKLLRY